MPVRGARAVVARLPPLPRHARARLQHAQAEATQRVAVQLLKHCSRLIGNCIRCLCILLCLTILSVAV